MAGLSFSTFDIFLVVAVPIEVSVFDRNSFAFFTQIIFIVCQKSAIELFRQQELLDSLEGVETINCDGYTVREELKNELQVGEQCHDSEGNRRGKWLPSGQHESGEGRH